jgi:hypothetical protein
MRPRRHQPERAEQASGVQLLRAVGARVWVLGTTRPKGDYPGTRQTPGICDVVAVLPRGMGVLFWEVKAVGGRFRPDQLVFREAVESCMGGGSKVFYCGGPCQALVGPLTGLGLVKPDALPHYRRATPQEATT